MPPPPYKLTIQGFRGMVLQYGPRMLDAAMRGMQSGAAAGVAELQRATDTVQSANPRGIGSGGAVNTGNFRRRWKMSFDPGRRAVSVYNDAPYAGPVDIGRRPGSRMPPLRVIARWAERRLGLPKDEARAAAFPIAKE